MIESTLTIDPPEGHAAPLDWREDVLIAAGATRVTVLKDESGAVVSVLTEPKITPEAYGKALKAIAENPPPAPPSPADKLASFLRANPDVAQMIGGGA
ncbi:MAG: hypothetical protein J0L51_07060 [Rhizobiales bacterium]|nr:hypothetical protein [Hyphomicrobiales bacterium]